MDGGGSAARHAPTGPGVTAVSRPSGRLANARSASSRTGRGGGQRADGQLAPQEPNA